MTEPKLVYHLDHLRRQYEGDSPEAVVNSMYEYSINGRDWSFDEWWQFQKDNWSQRWESYQEELLLNQPKIPFPDCPAHFREIVAHPETADAHELSEASEAAQTLLDIMVATSPLKEGPLPPKALTANASRW